MPVRCDVRRDAYFDSVVLMRVASDVHRRPGVHAASLVMATPPNKELLADAGLLDAAGRAAGLNDLIIAIDADDAALDDAIEAAGAALATPSAPVADAAAALRPRSLAEVDADLAIVSTPGRYAAAEATKALRRGMAVFLFSDNVALEDEVALKRLAHERGLLVMGPDCGTAIVGGVPLGFANEVRRGDIALVGASGTGLQQVSTLIDRWGAGVSHVVGVGSRDLSAEVGAISTLDALEALAADDATRVVVLVAKRPDPGVAQRVLARAAGIGRPVVVAFLGWSPRDPLAPALHVVDGLQDAAAAAVRLATGAAPVTATADAPDPPAPPHSGRRLLRGLYAGGTFADEARLLLAPRLGALSAEPPARIAPDGLADAHLVLDLGDDRFTVGRPHPMIDASVRVEMLRAAGDDPRTAVVLLDVVLGHGAAADPAGDLAPVVAEIARREDAPRVVAFVVGTAADPQGLERQERTLLEAGAHVASASTAAVRVAESMLAAIPVA